MSRKVLGKGLRALIPEPDKAGLADKDAGGSPGRATLMEAGVQAPWSHAGADARISAVPLRPRETLKYLPIDAIVPNPNQPRSDMDPASLEELSLSIRETGLLEPIVVRHAGDHFELVAGERRWRACRIAGWTEIPSLVRGFEDHESLEAALIENLQRADLNAVEEARAYRVLVEKYGLTHDGIARKVGKDRSTVSNLLRLLRLPQNVLDHVSRGTLSVGHVKILLGLPDDQVIAAVDRIIADGWSVRQVEDWVASKAGVSGKARRRRRTARSVAKPEEILRIEHEIRRHFATDARIRFSKRGGRIEIGFHDDEELSRILDILGVIVS
jgi:ParB family chromosome partitioning protein